MVFFYLRSGIGYSLSGVEVGAVLLRAYDFVAISWSVMTSLSPDFALK